MSSSPIPAEQRARVLLMPGLHRVRRQAVSQAEDLARSFASLSPSQVRGLANALGAGPQRRSDRERLNELARYLAWRAHRSQDTTRGWSKLAQDVQDGVGSIEGLCRSEVGMVRASEQAYWQTHAPALSAAQAWMELQAIDTFVHALERLTTVHQVTERS